MESLSFPEPLVHSEVTSITQMLSMHPGKVYVRGRLFLQNAGELGLTEYAALSAFEA